MGVMWTVCKWTLYAFAFVIVGSFLIWTALSIFGMQNKVGSWTKWLPRTSIIQTSAGLALGASNNTIITDLGKIMVGGGNTTLDPNGNIQSNGNISVNQVKINSGEIDSPTGTFLLGNATVIANSSGFYYNNHNLLPSSVSSKQFVTISLPETNGTVFKSNFTTPTMTSVYEIQFQASIVPLTNNSSSSSSVQCGFENSLLFSFTLPLSQPLFLKTFARGSSFSLNPTFFNYPSFTCSIPVRLMQGLFFFIEM